MDDDDDNDDDDDDDDNNNNNNNATINITKFYILLHSYMFRHFKAIIRLTLEHFKKDRKSCKC
jgi:hypothetical protein